MIEREIKLPFPTPEAARAAVVAAGGTPLATRRLQYDCLLDTPNGALRERRSALRVRRDAGRTILTFKGPPESARMKVREETETDAGDPDVLLAILDELGYRVWFRYEKYREEFTKDDVVIAVDETPMGTFVELEGGEDGIDRLARALGMGPDTYVLDSYRMLFTRRCEALGVPVADMLFDRG